MKPGFEAHVGDGGDQLDDGDEEDELAEAIRQEDSSEEDE